VFPCFLLVIKVGAFLQVSALASHWPEDFANFTPTSEGNDQYSANHLSAIQAASQSTFINEKLTSTCD
jgi:hypothetical protein